MLLFTSDVFLKTVDVPQQQCTLGKAVIGRRIHFTKVIGQIGYLVKQKRENTWPSLGNSHNPVNEQRTVQISIYYDTVSKQYCFYLHCSHGLLYLLYLIGFYVDRS